MMAGVTKLSPADNGRLGTGLVLGVEDGGAGKSGTASGSQKLSAGCFHMRIWQIELSAVVLRWCGQEDSNLHPFRDYDLNVARLPIPP